MPGTSLKHSYMQAVLSGTLQPDPEQAAVVDILDPLWRNIIRKQSLPRRLLSFLLQKPLPVPHGVYLWGPVGVGKSMLLDLLFAQGDNLICRRFHFHDFMRWVHEKLIQAQGQKNPLSKIFAEHFSGLRLLFLDEFLVEDATDALILKQVLEALLAHGVCFITTSNTCPDDLYQGGMYRERFLPAIALIKNNNHILSINSSPDYRCRTTSSDKRYYFPSNKQNYDYFRDIFYQVAQGEVLQSNIILFNREVEVVCHASNAIWFKFKNICGVPRATQDYLHLATTYDFIFIDSMSHILENDTVYIVNFIKLVDVLYERKVRLYIISDVAMTDLYKRGRYSDDFKRTLSRLIHMQSNSW